MSSLLRLIWAVVAMIVLVGVYRLVSTRTQRSEDQKILIDKSK